MRNVFGALVAVFLFATQSGAATLEPSYVATLTGPTSVIVGQSNTYTVNIGVVPVQPNYTLYALRLNVNGEFFSSFGTTLPENISITFNRIFETTGTSVLNVFALVQTYVNATFDPTEEFPDIKKPEGTLFENIRVDPNALEVTVTAVVPIGGTLPLMLSALGLIGWAARRRGKQGALPA